MVRKFGLRKGDAITGQVKQPRDGERREKFNPLVRIDTVNGAEPESAKSRIEFGKLTPLYPQDRLRLETERRAADDAAHRHRRADRQGPARPDRVAAKAGKTMVMQAIANAITTNNPECHLMVVLVDERPEEVTDMQRAVKGEVIASTFDRPAEDHTTVAELAIERAKRLVELGHDVVVLLDSHHPTRPRLQPGGAGQRPDPVRWCRLVRALPAEALLRCRPQHRGRRLADDPRHGADRDRLQDGRGHLRGVQGHRKHGAPAAPRVRRQADLPGGRRRRRPAPAARSC